MTNLILLVISLLSCIAYIIFSLIFKVRTFKREEIRYKTLKIIFLNCFILAMLCSLFPVLFHLTQNFSLLLKCILIILGLLAWFYARISEVSLIPLIKLYRNYDSEENILEWFSIIMFYVAIIMIIHILLSFGGKNLIIFVVSVVGTVCLSFVTNYLIGLTDKLLHRDPGNEIDNTHKAIWTYGLKRTEGKATRREVYEHYHGSFTWYKRFSGFLTFLRCLSIVFSTAVPALLLSSINLAAIIVSAISSLVIIFYKS